MFGGEAKIPESVKKAMLLGDYGDGRPLTARRIMAVKDAIDAEDSMREKGVSQFANPATREAALAKGYHPSELGRLANAVNYYMKATGATEEMALEVVATPGRGGVRKQPRVRGNLQPTRRRHPPLAARRTAFRRWRKGSRGGAPDRHGNCE